VILGSLAITVKEESYLGELSDHGTHRQELISGNAGAQVGQFLVDIVNTGTLESEHRESSIFVRCDKGVKRLSGVVGKLGEESASLFFGERTHIEKSKG
jgi:hypothetical protein